MNESTFGGEAGALNISDVLADKGLRGSMAKSGVSGSKDGRKETMTSFVEWSFQNRASNT